MAICPVCEGTREITIKKAEDEFVSVGITKLCPSCHGRGERPELVYVAGPYTHDDPVDNTRDAIFCGHALFDRGNVAFVPHLSMFEHFVNPKPYTYWIERGIRCVEVCDRVVRLPGPSSGADKECEHAAALDIPVLML